MIQQSARFGMAPDTDYTDTLMIPHVMVTSAGESVKSWSDFLYIDGQTLRTSFGKKYF